MKGHDQDACTRNWVCKASGCGERHNTWLHSAIAATNNKDSTNSTNLAARNEPAINQPPVVQSNATKRCLEPAKGKVALPILPVVVSDPDNRFSMNVLALLDNGSNGTFCSRKLIRALRLQTRETSIKLSTMESKDISVDTVAVNLGVEDSYQREAYLMN